ncbi:MAG: hypothetical protein JO006_20715 [Paucibacter sp.]|nr:hypothetical protein [Roseateles sp.]
MGGRRLKLARPALLVLLTLLALIAGMAVAAPAAPAQPSEPVTITWLVMEVPPFFNYNQGRPPRKPEELHGSGLDGLQRLLISRMPSEVNHVFVEAGLPRFEAMARGDQAVCSMFHVRTPERLQWLYFTHLLPPLESRELHVVVRRDQLARFQAKGAPLELSALLKRGDLKGLLPRDRSFGPRINALLATAGDNAPATVVSGHGMHILPMLRAGRMDYTLEYPLVVETFLHENPQGPDLAMLPLVEGRSTELATVACSRNPAGRRAIEIIDAAERSLAQDPHRDALILEWRGTVSEADRVRLRRYLDERARSGPQIE